MKKNKKGILLVSFVVVTLLFLSGCQNMKMWFKDFEQSFKGLEMTVRTYDDESQMIDQISGKSVFIQRDETFDSAEDQADSAVLRIGVGNRELHHVGSSMVVAETGLTNVFDEFSAKNDLQNLDRSVPIVNRMVSDFKNAFSGKKKVILIRSQRGYPLATYAGDKVSLYKTDVPKSTGILIDGKYLFIYRCDYTIYDREILE